MSHAKLSPSSADRWMTCPGSIVLSEGMPNRSSKFADEGTLAHALGEACLLDELPAQAFAGTLFDYDDHDEKKSELISLEMANHVQTYVDYVVGLGGELHAEQKVAVNDKVYGTGDAVVWQADTKSLHIVDLKYGAGLPVEIEGNLQLKIYALATLLTFKFPAKTVTATIVQPRCPHSDGPVRSVTYDVVELLDFHADLEDAVARVEASVGIKEDIVRFPDEFPEVFVPTVKGCRWCLASPKCPALQNKAQDSAKQVFAAGIAYDPSALAKTLDDLPLIEGWIKNVREFAYSEAERGSDIPDWKLVEKRATRKWRDEATVAKHPLFLGLEIYDAPSLKSPATLEKLLPKEKRGLLDELCVKESSGHTLVHESDKRPAIRVDAKSAFANS